ncbi:uncharacterized protein METZ01_LOCUS234871, partial [marine metagenome]
MATAMRWFLTFSSLTTTPSLVVMIRWVDSPISGSWVTTTTVSPS